MHQRWTSFSRDWSGTDHEQWVDQDATFHTELGYLYADHYPICLYSRLGSRGLGSCGGDEIITEEQV